MSGCAVQPAGQLLPDPGIVVELSDTPFFPQETYQCGPAALATVLQASGVELAPTDLVPTVYTPGRRGSLQVDLLAAARAAGRLPYELDGELSAVVAELVAGRPVLVLQNLGINLIPKWHYAVVVGIDAARGMVVLRSGSQRRRETPIKLFLKTWNRGSNWAFTALRPGEFPQDMDRERYMTAVAALEEIGRTAAAAQFWRAALEQWPDNAVALFGLGNSLLADGEAVAAEVVFRDLLETRPDVVAVRNNLAIALRDQARYHEALVEIDDALEDATDPALLYELQDTKRQIERAIRRSSR